MKNKRKLHLKKKKAINNQNFLYRFKDCDKELNMNTNNLKENLSLQKKKHGTILTKLFNFDKESIRKVHTNFMLL
jgi:hypothetical protein